MGSCRMSGARSLWQLPASEKVAETQMQAETIQMLFIRVSSPHVNLRNTPADHLNMPD